jgi:hypothetical protein
MASIYTEARLSQAYAIFREARQRYPPTVSSVARHLRPGYQFRKVKATSFLDAVAWDDADSTSDEYAPTSSKKRRRSTVVKVAKPKRTPATPKKPRFDNNATVNATNRDESLFDDHDASPGLLVTLHMQPGLNQYNIGRTADEGGALPSKSKLEKEEEEITKLERGVTRSGLKRKRALDRDNLSHKFKMSLDLDYSDCSDDEDASLLKKPKLVQDSNRDKGASAESNIPDEIDGDSYETNNSKSAEKPSPAPKGDKHFYTNFWFGPNASSEQIEGLSDDLINRARLKARTTERAPPKSGTAPETLAPKAKETATTNRAHLPVDQPAHVPVGNGAGPSTAPGCTYETAIVIDDDEETAAAASTSLPSSTETQSSITRASLSTALTTPSSLATNSSSVPTDGPFLKQNADGTMTYNTCWSYPFNFRYVRKKSSDPRCDFCADFRFGIYGYGMIHATVFVDPDNPQNLQEMGNGHRANGYPPTKMCTACAAQRIRISMCGMHKIDQTQAIQYGPEFQAYVQQLGDSRWPRTAPKIPQPPLPTCSLCVNPAFYGCVKEQERRKNFKLYAEGEARDKGCGLLLCVSCEESLKKTKGELTTQSVVSIPGQKSTRRADFMFLIKGSSMHDAYFPKEK